MNRPEPGVEYAAAPTQRHAAHNVSEATRSLSRAWGVTEARAAELLEDPAEYRAECPKHVPPSSPEDFGIDPVTGKIGGMSARAALRVLERRYPSP